MDLTGVLQAGVYHVSRLVVACPVAGALSLRAFNVPDLRAVPGGVLLAANHQSFLDPVLIGLVANVPLKYMARRNLFAVPGFGMLVRALGAHPISRGTADTTALKTAMRLLRTGEKLLMFPEGTRTRDGRLGEFRPGVAAIAARCHVPILPVCVEGAFDSWPRTRALPRPARVAVAFGEMMRTTGRDAAGLTRDLRAREKHLQSMLRGFLDSVTGRTPRARHGNAPAWGRTVDREPEPSDGAATATGCPA